MSVIFFKVQLESHYLQKTLIPMVIMNLSFPTSLIAFCVLPLWWPLLLGPMSVNYMYASVSYICKLCEFLRIGIMYLILYPTLNLYHLPVHKMRTLFIVALNEWVLEVLVLALSTLGTSGQRRNTSGLPSFAWSCSRQTGQSRNWPFV